MTVDEPDVADEHLDDWTPAPLAGGFVIEDARVRDDADLSETDATAGRIAASTLDGVALRGSRLRSLSLIDVIARDIDASNADWTGARCTRVAFERCRLTGLRMAELEADEVVFRDCRMDLADLRGAQIRRALFESCALDEADLRGATLQSVRFAHCQLRRAELDRARLDRVDLRGCELELRGDLSVLRGATIDTVQLIGLARAFAGAAGIVVDDGQAA